MQAPHVSERSEGERTALMQEEGGPWAASLPGPERRPRSFILFLFFSFSFLFSLFFQNFFKIAPKHFKPNPKVFLKFKTMF
jgi:hypothetical protein